MLIQENVALIILSLFGLILGIVYLFIYITEKNKNPYLLVSAIIWFLSPVLIVIAVCAKSDSLCLCAICLPIGVNTASTLIELLLRYKKCTYLVSAKCVSYTTRGRGMYYSPEFSYYYSGKSFSEYSFTNYTKRKFKRNFIIDNTYDIYINPNNPKQCVDKRVFPIGEIIWLIISAAFFIAFPIVAMII